jgi:streptogramin lyase
MQEYSLPLANSGVMRPALDHEGRIWFGEMGHNYLAVFDPKTQNFQQITPPHGASGIMGMTVARDDTIWFAELDANYIGQYNAKTHQFHTYALPQLKLSATNSQDSVKTLPSAPNDVAIDAGGNVWFTEMNADALGKLDPRTGATTQYPISHPQTIQKLDPYGITIDAHGVVWFTETSKGILGRFDPRTEKMRFIPTPNAGISLMEVTNDPNGNIWATAFNSSQLFKFTPATNTFATYNADQNGTGSSGMYGLTAPTAQAVWVTVSSENAIAKFDPVTQHFTYYQIPTPNSTPFGMVVSKDHHIWFTEAGGNKVGMLTP